MPIFVVETIHTFRHKYVIDCKSLDHALDTVAMEEAEEFSQMSLGEQIIGGREITMDDFNRMISSLKDGGCGDGTHYQPESGAPWLGEKLIHKVKYED